MTKPSGSSPAGKDPYHAITQRPTCSIKPLYLPYLLNTSNYLQHFYDNDIVNRCLQTAKIHSVLCGFKNKMIN